MRGRLRTWLVIITAGYLLGALVIGLWPTPVDAGLHDAVRSALSALRRGGLPGASGYSQLEFQANVAFFVPIGVLLCLLAPRRLWPLAIPASALLSGAIELSQLLLLPARFASWNDIVANTIGATTGVLLVFVVRVTRSALAPRASSAPQVPAHDPTARRSDVREKTTERRPRH